MKICIPLIFTAIYTGLKWLRLLYLIRTLNLNFTTTCLAPARTQCHLVSTIAAAAVASHRGKHKQYCHHPADKKRLLCRLWSTNKFTNRDRKFLSLTIFPHCYQIILPGRTSTRTRTRWSRRTATKPTINLDRFLMRGWWSIYNRKVL